MQINQQQITYIRFNSPAATYNKPFYTERTMSIIF